MEVSRWIRAQWDRCCAAALVAGGLLVVVGGWVGLSATGYPAEQLPYLLSAGVGGSLLVGLGGVLWLSADLRDEWRKLNQIAERLAVLPSPDGAGERPVRTDGVR